MKKINEKWIGGYFKRRGWLLKPNEDDFFDADELYCKDKHRILLGQVCAAGDLDDMLPYIEVYVSPGAGSWRANERFVCIFNGTVYDRGFLEKMFYSIEIYSLYKKRKFPWD